MAAQAEALAAAEEDNAETLALAKQLGVDVAAQAEALAKAAEGAARRPEGVADDGPAKRRRLSG